MTEAQSWIPGSPSHVEGRRAARRGDDEVSIALLESIALRSGCDAIDALCCLADMKLRRGRTTRAGELIARAMQRVEWCGHQSCRDRVRITAANVAIENGDAEEALQLLGTEVYGSLRGRWLIAKGRLCAAARMYIEAAWLFERAMREGTGSGHTYDEARVRFHVAVAMQTRSPIDEAASMRALCDELRENGSLDLEPLLCAAEAMARAAAGDTSGYDACIGDLVLALSRGPRVDTEQSSALARASDHWRAAGDEERALLAQQLIRASANPDASWWE